MPQTRQRLILRASRGLLPYLPEPVRWVGWITAIEDLLPALPESKLAPWQYTRLKGELRRPVLINQTNTMEVRETWEPAAVQVSSSRSNRQRAVFPETGRVVQMTPRALARFQSFPDSYILPERRQLAARVIGNAVPPLLMQRIAEDMLWAQ